MCYISLLVKLKEKYGGWFVPYRINVFSGQKRERSPRENLPNGYIGDFFLHGDLLPRQAKIRQTVAENATHGMSRTFLWRGERSPCENSKKSTFGEFSRGAFSPRNGDNKTWHKSATIEKCYASWTQFFLCLIWLENYNVKFTLKASNFLTQTCRRILSMNKHNTYYVLSRHRNLILLFVCAIH